MRHMDFHAAMFSLQINTTQEAFQKKNPSVCEGLIKAYTSPSDMAVRGMQKKAGDHWFKL